MRFSITTLLCSLAMYFHSLPDLSESYFSFFNFSLFKWEEGSARVISAQRTGGFICVFRFYYNFTINTLFLSTFDTLGRTTHHSY